MTRTAIQRFFLSLVCSLIVFFFAETMTLSHSFSFVLAWDVFGMVYIVMSLVVFSRMDHEDIRIQCAREDLGSWVLFGFIVVVCITSFSIVISLFREIDHWNISSFWGAFSCITAISFAWILVHLSFTFRYAHLYYGDDNKHFSRQARGLIFPEENHPDYFDFAYFSFVIGMTFQVSDVVITAKGVRRLALLHSLIAFVFNTVIIALTISQVVGFTSR